MILIIGGAFQGKRAFAIDEFKIDEHDMADGATVALDKLSGVKAIYNFHLLIKRMIDEGADPYIIFDSMPSVIICDEIGSGLIPIDEKDRRWREAVGRVLSVAAKRADTFIRVFCGLPIVLKGSLPI